jgi:D-alanyl-D-alanine carboxypeptidase/D-alanyl-D-alanine-endopeptidase (penicillin-binding protein 4)
MRLIFALCMLVALPAAGAPADSLPANVQAALNKRNVPHDTLSVFAQDVDSGEVVLSWLEDTPRNPGSTIKLLTTLAALDILGPTYEWQTNVYALGEIDDGRLEGDLLIEGRGDPFLVTERVWQLLRRLRQAGIRDISGKLLLDDRFFDVSQHDPAAFDRQPLRAYNVAPNALMMNFKMIRFWFEPEPGTRKVRVWLDPAIENLAIDNRLRLVAGPCRGYQRGITILANEAMDGISLSGRFPDGCKAYRMDRTALSHNAYVYGLVESLWRESGGRLDGGWARAAAPDNVEPLLEFRSLPLADVITRVNKHSNNVMARHLLYTLSAERLGEPGTEAGGRQVIDEWLQRNGLELSSMALDNGAGLSREARMAARDFGALLHFAWQLPTMPEFVASMSLSGLDGTLSRRYKGSPITGNAHLKTGSLDHVTAIAGYLQARSGRRFSVVMLHNHTDIHRGPGEEAQEALLRWLFEQ